MRSGWHSEKLGEICEIIKGKKPHYLMPAKKAQKGDKPYLVAKVMRGTEVAEYVPVNDLAVVEVKSNDTIIICDGSNSGEIFTGFSGVLASTMGKVLKKKEIDDRYLRVFLTSTFSVFNGAKIGAAIPHLDKDALFDLEIPLPPLHEQQRIVGILDEAFESIAKARANAEKNLANARELFEGHRQRLILDKQWQWGLLGDFCNGVEYGSAAKSKKVGKIPVIRMGNIQGGSIDWTDLVYTDNAAEAKKYLLKPGDVLFNRTNSPALVGKTAIYQNEQPAIFAGYLIRILRKPELLDAEFLNYFLNSKFAQDHGKSVASSSVNQANISGAKLKEYPIPIPPLNEQRGIVKKLNVVKLESSKLEMIYRKKIRILDSLKASVLDQAFAGGL